MDYDFNPEAVRDMGYELQHAERDDALAMDAIRADGEWISTAHLDCDQIEEARQDQSRCYVNRHGYGWVWYPSGREIPENVREAIRADLAKRSPVPWRDTVRPLDDEARAA